MHLRTRRPILPIGWFLPAPQSDRTQQPVIPRCHAHIEELRVYVPNLQCDDDSMESIYDDSDYELYEEHSTGCVCNAKNMDPNVHFLLFPPSSSLARPVFTVVET